MANLATLADEMVLVDDDALIAAMRLAHCALGLVLEPSGAAALAALAVHAGQFHGQRSGIVLTGGNVTPEQTQEWLRLRVCGNRSMPEHPVDIEAVDVARWVPGPSVNARNSAFRRDP